MSAARPKAVLWISMEPHVEDSAVPGAQEALKRQLFLVTLFNCR
uniref:Uncharacterized protein n=1 Tax=Malurus cyaneus samueli TaxID=2593467 RepID=A0A8C5X470_9PASS